MILVQKEHVDKIDSNGTIFEAIETVKQLLLEGKAVQVYLGKTSFGIMQVKKLIQEGYEVIDFSFE